MVQFHTISVDKWWLEGLVLVFEDVFDDDCVEFTFGDPGKEFQPGCQTLLVDVHLKSQHGRGAR